MFKHFSKILTIIFVIISITACSGGSDSSDPVVPDAPILPDTQALTSVTGVFVDDMPIARAVITITDAAGVTREVTTDDNGLYYVEVNDLQLPLLVVGTYTTAGVVHKQYSFVSADKSTADSVTANINEYTTLLVSAMTQEAGVAISTVAETVDDATRNLILGVDYLPTIASMDELFCSVLLNPDGSPQGCEWGSSEDILTISYAPTVDGTGLDRLVALMDVTVDPTTGDVIIADSTGVTIATITLDELVADTIPADTLTSTDIANLEAVYTPAASIIPIENEDVQTQLTSSGTVIGVAEYVSVFPLTNLFVDNLTECPVESRDFVVTPGDNAQTPVVLFADYQLEIDTSPELVPVVSRTSISPTDACRPYAFDYQFDYNMLIRKTQTGLVDGIPVWTYDVPACEQYSNKTIENILQESYQYTGVDFDLLFNLPSIEVRPALHRYSESWPNSSVNFVYDSACPMVAEFSVTPISGVAPLTVSVDANLSGGPVDSYSWSTSDGQTAVGLTSSFTFATVGTHSITLTVANSGGVTEVIAKTVTVDPVPVAGFTWGTGASLQVNLDGSSSTGAGISSYQWMASDGQTATGQTSSLTFASAGSYSVTLTITDRNGETSIVTQTVVAEEVSLVLSCSSYSSDMCATYTFTEASDIALFTSACSEVSSCTTTSLTGVCDTGTGAVTGGIGDVQSDLYLYLPSFTASATEATCLSIGGTWTPY